MNRTAVALLITLALCACTLPDPLDSAPLSQPHPLPPFVATEVGIGEDYPEESRELSAMQSDVALVRNTGARVLRVSIGWDGIESAPGHFDWLFVDRLVDAASRAGLRLIPYVCYTPAWAARSRQGATWTSPPRDVNAFASFVGALAARYRGRITSWELWNEPDNRQYWSGTPAEFVALLDAGSRAVRKADPGATIVLGGIAGDLGFLDAVFALGAGRTVDVVNLHAYFETWSERPIEDLADHIRDAAAIVAKYGGHHALWLAEAGYSSQRVGAHVSDWSHARWAGEHTARAQATALWRTVATALSTGRVTLVTWYRLHDLPASQDVIGDVNNRYLGIVAADGTRKPSFAALAGAIAAFDGPLRPLDDELTIVRRLSSPVEAHAFERADGEVIVTLWLRVRVHGPESSELGREPDRREETLALGIPRTLEGRLGAIDEEGHAQRAPRIERRGVTTWLTGIRVRGGGAVVIRFQGARPTTG